MASARGIVRRCMKCGIDGSHLGSRLKKCMRCAERGIEFPYCSKNCQVAHWQILKVICCNKNAIVVTDPDAMRQLSRWWVVYKPVIEWALHQLFLVRAREVDSKNPYLAIELEHAPGAPASNIPRLQLTRLTKCPLVTEVQVHLPEPFAMEDTQMVRCKLKGYEVIHKCAANNVLLATVRDESPCPRWTFVLAEMITFGFQDQTLLIESLRLAIARHFTFEAFLGTNSPLRGVPFPPLSQRMPPNLNISPWIWIKDVRFVDWFEREAGMTVATRLAELQAQTHRDAYTEKLIRWATDPLSPTLD